jgi:hypothetical protein
MANPGKRRFPLPVEVVMLLTREPVPLTGFYVKQYQAL